MRVVQEKMWSMEICGKFERKRWALVDVVSRIVGYEWLVEYGGV